MDPALLTAIISIIVAISGIIFGLIDRQRAIEKERKARHYEIQSKLGELEATFLQEKIAQRYRTYPEVFKVLGAVPDVSDPDNMRYESLERNRGQLQDIADKLLAHLYGDAGLVMDMSTRNALLETWFACHLFRKNSVSLRELIDCFYTARRALRADLQLNDGEQGKRELDKIKERIGSQTHDEKNDVDKYLMPQR